MNNSYPNLNTIDDLGGFMNQITHSYQNVKIAVVAGDITKQEVDAIVNPANSLLIMGGGVAAAIKRSGGREIEDEAIKKAPVVVGKAIATRAGRLCAKYIIHAPTMRQPAMQIDMKNIKLAVNGALECAEKLGVRSIAFPGMGTGVGGVEVDKATMTMVEEVKNHIALGTSLRQIVFVGFAASSAQSFEQAINKAFTKPSEQLAYHTEPQHEKSSH